MSALFQVRNTRFKQGARRWLLGLGILASCEVPTAPEPPAAGYFVVEATGIDAESFTVAGFNRSGDILLNKGGESFRFRAGELLRLETVAGASVTIGFAMNENGDVVGVAFYPAGTDQQAPMNVRWQAGSPSPTSFLSAGPAWNFVADINDEGDAIMSSRHFSQADVQDTAFILWTPTGTEPLILANRLSSGAIVTVTRMNNSREVLANVVSGFSNSIWVLSSRAGVTGGSCPSPGSKLLSAVALNDSGFYVARGSQHCLFRPGREILPLSFSTNALGLNNNGWMIGELNEDGGPVPVIAVRPETTESVEELFADDADRHGWTIEQFVALNDDNVVLAIANKGGAREFVFLRPK